MGTDEFRLLEDGRLDELAARHGVTIPEVRRMMGHEFFARRRRGRLDLDEVRRLDEAGQSLVKVGAARGASTFAVWKAMMKAGIPRRPDRQRRAGPTRGALRRRGLSGAASTR
jgi:hypothetical protein